MFRSSHARRPSPALMVALLALTLALGGTSYAAITLPSNSVGAKQLKRNAVTGAKVRDKSLRARDFADGQLPSGPAGLKGNPGPKGDIGAAGPKGDPGSVGGGSDVVTTATGVTTVTGDMTVMSLSLPAGSWFVTSHVGGAYNGTTASARLECSINEPGGSDGDFSKLRVPANTDAVNSLVFTDMTLHAVVTLAAPTVVKTSCSVVQSPSSFTLTGHKMTAIRAATVARQ